MTVRRLETVHRPRYFDFVMYYIYGQSGPSLLIESTDSMIMYSQLPWEDSELSCNPQGEISLSYIADVSLTPLSY